MEHSVLAKASLGVRVSPGPREGGSLGPGAGGEVSPEGLTTRREAGCQEGSGFFVFVSLLLLDFVSVSGV